MRITSARDDKLCFVQFLHPGGEHKPKTGLGWNTGPHRRKFLLSRGCCLRENELHEGELLFWGEWEAQADIAARIKSPLADGPTLIYRPYYTIPTSYAGLQNTDPFVFEQFFYTGCQQYTVNGPTQLRSLEKGSVVLFGSSLGGRFVVDTVFVVESWIEHDQHSVMTNAYPQVPDGYRDVTLKPWYLSNNDSCKAPQSSVRLYFGATHKEPFADMYSFFPCIPYSEGSSGFVRPVIDIAGITNGACQQGKRLNPQPNLSTTARLWDEVVQQVEAQGCSLGIHADMPPRRNGMAS